MQRHWVVLVALLVGDALGCGGAKKEAADPSDKPASTGGDEPTKWEGASSAPPPEDPKPASSGGSSGSSGGRAVQEKPTRRTDQYDKEHTETVIRRAARQVKDNCGAAKNESGVATGPWGKLTVQVQLGANGRSKGVTVPSPYKDTPAGNCIENAFNGLHFPPWSGSDTQVDWELELVKK